MGSSCQLDDRRLSECHLQPARKGRDVENVISRSGLRQVGPASYRINWYAARAMEGYFEETGRAGAGWTGFDYERMKDLPPLARTGPIRSIEMWANSPISSKAVIRRPRWRACVSRCTQTIPRAEQPGVPADHGTIDGWKKTDRQVNSPSNRDHVRLWCDERWRAILSRCCRWFASRDRINHVISAIQGAEAE